MPAKEFIRIWQSSKNRLEVASRAKSTMTRVAARAGYMRRTGIKLKKFPRGRPARTK